MTNRPGASSGPEDMPWVLALGPLGLLVCLAGFLGYQSYAILESESVILALTLAAVGLAAGGLALAAGRWGVAALIAGVFLLVADFGGLGAALGLPNRFVLPMVLVGAVSASALLGPHAARVFTAVLAATLAATVFFPVTSETPVGEWQAEGLAAAPSDLPSVVHIILDGHAGVGGLPVDIEGGARTRNLLRGFYSSHGFRLYEGVYSRYSLSADSITNLLNYTALADHAVHMTAAGHPPVRRLQFFQDLTAAGYQIKVYQSDAMDFCSAPAVVVNSCLTYPYRSLAWLQGLNLPVAERTALLARTFLRGSMIFRVLAGTVTPAPAAPASHAGVGVPETLKRLAADIRAGAPGTYYFAHLLLPHEPYSFDAACNIRPSLDLWRAGDRTGAYSLYFEQVQCLYVLLEVFLDGLGDRLIVLLHGDHGARLAATAPSATTAQGLSRRDYLDTYATLFAVRAPGLAPGTDERAAPLDRVFGRIILPAIGLPPVGGSGSGKVFLPNPSGGPMGAVDWPGGPATPGSSKESP